MKIKCENNVEFLRVSFKCQNLFDFIFDSETPWKVFDSGKPPLH